jgi:hypothetical protein
MKLDESSESVHIPPFLHGEESQGNVCWQNDTVFPEVPDSS